MDSKSKDLSSNLSGTTMKSFKYNGKIWNPKNPEKKLKQLGITWDDVEIIEDVTKKEQLMEFEDPNRLYYFINRKTGWSITSIHPYVNDSDYEQCSREDIAWNKI